MNEQQTKGWISFRVKPAEYQKIHGHFSKSIHRKLSEYARNVLLQKPVIFRTRNDSADAWLKEMLQLKNELSAIGNNYNQVVRKLHILNHTSEINSWLTIHDKLHSQFKEKIEQIYFCLNEIHQKWLSE